MKNYWPIYWKLKKIEQKVDFLYCNTPLNPKDENTIKIKWFYVWFLDNILNILISFFLKLFYFVFILYIVFILWLLTWLEIYHDNFQYYNFLTK
jgi:hypothetical protein